MKLHKRNSRAVIAVLLCVALMLPQFALIAAAVDGSDTDCEQFDLPDEEILDDQIETVEVDETETEFSVDEELPSEQAFRFRQRTQMGLLRIGCTGDLRYPGSGAAYLRQTESGYRFLRRTQLCSPF